MLEFSSKPDRVFLAILHDSLKFHRQKIQNLVEQQDPIVKWRCLFPRLAVFLTPQAALALLDRLVAASRDPNVYRLTDFHWLVLYDFLERFCSIVNRKAAATESKRIEIGPYWIGHIVFTEINERYFWDNDFLLGPILLELGADQRHSGNFDISDEAFSIAAGLPPHPHELRIERCASSPEWDTDEDNSPPHGFIPCYPATVEDSDLVE